MHDGPCAWHLVSEWFGPLIPLFRPDNVWVKFAPLPHGDRICPLHSFDKRSQKDHDVADVCKTPAVVTSSLVAPQSSTRRQLRPVDPHLPPRGSDAFPLCRGTAVVPPDPHIHRRDHLASPPEDRRRTGRICRQGETFATGCRFRHRHRHPRHRLAIASPEDASPRPWPCGGPAGKLRHGAAAPQSRARQW